MKCQNNQPAIDVSLTGKGSIDSMAAHCAEIAKAAEAASQLNGAETDSAERLLVVPNGKLAAGDIGCDCPAGCVLTAPALLSNVELPVIQQQLGDTFVFNLRSVEKSFPSQPYRPPIA